MERKKALLVIAGGRGLPDFLALFCVRPHLVAILTSTEGWEDEQLFRDAVGSQPQFETLLPPQHVDSYDMEATRRICLQTCQPYPQSTWEWTFSIGSCPKIMGIGAYEAAKDMGIPCIHMDVQHEKVVSLVKTFSPIPPNIFHFTVDDYLQIYGREADVPPSRKRDRRQIETWGHIARTVALSPVGALFTQQAFNKQVGAPIEFPSVSPQLLQLLKDLERYKSIRVKSDKNGVQCTFTSKKFADFLGTGKWLEIYVWDEAKKRGFADDYQWGYNVKNTSHSMTIGEGKAPNELDGLFMYKAQLILIECKTGKTAFKGEKHYLDILNDKSDMLGRSYVTKIFVTNENKTQSSYTDFAKRAEVRKIVVVTAEDLPNIGQILEQEAKNPRYKRK